jgi:hypothetical protein
MRKRIVGLGRRTFNSPMIEGLHHQLIQDNIPKIVLPSHIIDRRLKNTYLFLIGKLNENVAPFPSLLFSAHSLPPWASIILFDINNPNPVP